jgi:hypothetical protein
MTRSPDSLIPSVAGQPVTEKRDDQAFNGRQEGEANLRAATEVNVVPASSTPAAIRPIERELLPGRACPLEAKPATVRNAARRDPSCRGGVEDAGWRRLLFLRVCDFPKGLVGAAGTTKLVIRDE